MIYFDAPQTTGPLLIDCPRRSPIQYMKVFTVNFLTFGPFPVPIGDASMGRKELQPLLPQ